MNKPKKSESVFNYEQTVESNSDESSGSWRRNFVVKKKSINSDDESSKHSSVTSD